MFEIINTTRIAAPAFVIRSAATSPVAVRNTYAQAMEVAATRAFEAGAASLI